MIINLAGAIGLVILGISDFITRKVPMAVILGWGIVGLIIELYMGEIFCLTRLIALIPGILLFLLAKASGEKLGYGDAWTVLVMGLYMDIQRLMAVGMMAITFAGVTALILITICRKGKDYEMPFIPFLLVGYSAEWALNVIGV